MTNIPLQETSKDIWDQKYRLRDRYGTPVDNSIEDTYKRVARALADLEEDRNEYYDEFLWALNNGAIPAGRIMSNAGAKEHKPATSTINCTVSGIIEDSMDGILHKVYEGGNTLKAGCGIGYEFSTLRPKGAYVKGAGASTSGALSFMDIYDKMCFTIASSGGRRGAQMATFDVSHPDVEQFISAKREDGKFRQFNLSLLITEEFMEAVKADGDWNLVFPLKSHEDVANHTVVWKKLPNDDFIVDERGKVACKVYKTIKAKELWDTIMKSTYDYAEPGFILIDKVNDMNNNWFCEDIRKTNPCGEQPLPPYGSCLLGSINLTVFVRDAFTENASFDWVSYRRVIRIFTRMLDNVVEINGLPLEKQREEIYRKRRHGMGYLGLGSTMAMLGINYGSANSIDFADEVTKILALEGFIEGTLLAEEKGAAPIMDEVFKVTEEMLIARPAMALDGYKAGDDIYGRRLIAKYSKYMNLLGKEYPDLITKMDEVGCRFTHHSSIAPTGTISLSLANNVSNGIEPSFSQHYSRNVIKEGKKTKQKMDVFSYELLAYRALIDKDALNDLPNYFISADTITPKEHIDIQAAAQKWIDSSISKTINIPTDYPFEAFEDTYMYAYNQGLKGCTTFRFNPEAFQGVLVKESDLENTKYTFSLEDGSSVAYKGNDIVTYDGEEHTAANLFDALKEGYYGKF